MSERALEFVENWVSEHIEAGALAPDPDGSKAAALARQCQNDALAQGIPPFEISEQFDDLAAFIAGQMAEASERAGPHEDDEEVLAEEVLAKGRGLEEEDAAEDAGQNEGVAKPEA
jgi:hypothetical protein